MSIIGRGGLTLMLAGMAGWGILALFFTLPVTTIRLPLIIAYGMVSMLLVVGRPRYGVVASFFLFFMVVAWFFSLSPSNTRDWQDDVAKLAWAEIHGDTLTVHNIRNCEYRSETDYSCRYYDRTVTLDDLQTLDLLHVYWGSPYIAHTMLSFGFKDGGYICFSIETRKEKGEEYSAVKGFFRQYEQVYVVADEDDLVRLRTNYRHEDVYLYRLKVSPVLAKKVFLDYLATVNSLYQQPQWYNALTANCTTSIRQHTLPYNPDAKFDWRIIVNGFIDEMIYQRGTIDTSLPYAELKRRSYINPKAEAVTQDQDYSTQIRHGLPGMEL